MSLVAVAVPIWNSYREVERTISTVSEVAAMNLHQVSLLVSDNCSDDGTWNALEGSVLAHEPSIKLIRQETNLGFRGNLLALAQAAKSKYIWFLGAGEKIEPKVFHDLVTFLESHDVGNLILRGKLKNSEQIEAVENTLLKTNFEPVLEGYPYSETISLNIFLRESVIEHLSQPKELAVSDNSWPHLEIAIHAWGGNPVYKQGGAAAVDISQNPHGWWFHGVNSFDIFSDKLTLGALDSRISGSGEYARLAGVGAIFHVIEVRLNGLPQPRAALDRLLKLIDPRWTWLLRFSYFCPLPVLKLGQKLRQFFR